MQGQHKFDNNIQQRMCGFDNFLTHTLIIVRANGRLPTLMTDLPPLNTDTIWAILKEEIDDTTVNRIVWHHLGYRYDEATQTWDISNVAEDWSEQYPEPPDFIANRPPTVKLTRSIPKENKQLLKEKLGFQGYKLGEFGPRQTRRATAANWLLSHIEQSS